MSVLLFSLTMASLTSFNSNLNASTDSLSIVITLEWLNESLSNSSKSSFTNNLNEMSEQCINPKDDRLSNAIKDFKEAIRWRQDASKFKKYIESSYDNCRYSQNSSILKYSLLISSGFIYHSNYGKNLMNGLKEVYHVLTDMNSDMILLKLLNSSITKKSKCVRSKQEKYLINSVVHFSVRCNSFIRQIVKVTVHQIAQKLHHNDDEKDSLKDEPVKEQEVQPILSRYGTHNKDTDKYLKCEEWYPRYYDGYYFGKIQGNPYKFPKLGIADFRDIMNAGKSPCRIIIDDLYIHTFDIDNSLLFVQSHKKYKHHWFYGDNNWFDFKQEKFVIQVTITGQRHFVTVNFYDTIKSIKDKISMKMSVPSTMLKLEYNGQSLKENYFVYDYKITKGKELHAKLQSFNPFLNLMS